MYLSYYKCVFLAGGGMGREVGVLCRKITPLLFFFTPLLNGIIFFRHLDPDIWLTNLQ